MDHLKRMQVLSGRNPNQEEVDRLTAELAQITTSYTEAIEAAKRGGQLDEGVWTNLLATFNTALKLGADGSKRVLAKVKQASASVRTLYRDQKVQVELKALLKGVAKLLIDFEELSKKSPTLLTHDKDVKLEMDSFQKRFTVLVDTLASRAALQEGLTELPEIKAILEALASQVDESVVEPPKDEN